MAIYNPRSQGRRRLVAEINVVPFIDVMLVLLVIFMITAPLLTQGVKIELPEAAAKTLPPDQQEPLVVTVDAAGNYYLNVSDNPAQPITPRVLTNIVATQLLMAQQAHQERAVMVKGDKNVNYGKVIEAMVLLQQCGAKSVGLVTESPQSDIAL